jgi:hypothetical protein
VIVHGYRNTASIKYEAWLAICEDVSSFLMVENHLKNWKKTIITDRTQAMQGKTVM